MNAGLNNRTCPTCAAQVSAEAIWCAQCKQFQPPVDGSTPRTKQCPHCGDWVPISANYCMRCSKGLGPIVRRFSWLQLPVAGLSALSALIATVVLGASNLMQYANRHSNTSVTFEGVGARDRSVELGVAKSGANGAHLTKFFLLVSATDSPVDQAASCMIAGTPQINTRTCRVVGDARVTHVCVKVPLVVNGKNSASIKEETSTLAATAVLRDAIKDIVLSVPTQNDCGLDSKYADDAALVNDMLKRADVKRACDIHYSAKESNAKTHVERTIANGPIADCGTILTALGG